MGMWRQIDGSSVVNKKIEIALYSCSYFFEYIKIDRDKSTFKSHRDFSSEKEISFKHF